MEQRAPQEAGGIVRVLAPTSKIRPSASCCMTTGIRISSQVEDLGTFDLVGAAVDRMG
jgi:hypothetical protein